MSLTPIWLMLVQAEAGRLPGGGLESPVRDLPPEARNPATPAQCDAVEDVNAAVWAEKEIMNSLDNFRNASSSSRYNNLSVLSCSWKEVELYRPYIYKYIHPHAYCVHINNAAGVFSRLQTSRLPLFIPLLLFSFSVLCTLFTELPVLQ